ncbi:hypothetical protein IEO21_09646 [Rhodonia placenta]|uniref:C2H2-type domain-containing protein n=1 Tax=Rhodonia placenta TaxID=104341 RepID=A0A8H7NTZ5_9APHY|nr:hypothetical protein IEO21_09646 [Postia placenta]
MDELADYQRELMPAAHNRLDEVMDESSRWTAELVLLTKATDGHLRLLDDSRAGRNPITPADSAREPVVDLPPFRDMLRHARPTDFWDTATPSTSSNEAYIGYEDNDTVDELDTMTGNVGRLHPQYRELGSTSSSSHPAEMEDEHQELHFPQEQQSVRLRVQSAEQNLVHASDYTGADGAIAELHQETSRQHEQEEGHSIAHREVDATADGPLPAAIDPRVRWTDRSHNNRRAQPTRNCKSANAVVDRKERGANTRKGRTVIDAGSSRGTVGRPALTRELAQPSTSSAIRQHVQPPRGCKRKAPAGDNAEGGAEGEEPRAKRVKAAVAKKPMVVQVKAATAKKPRAKQGKAATAKKPRVPCPHPACKAALGRDGDLRRHHRETRSCPLYTGKYASIYTGCGKKLPRKDAWRRHIRNPDACKKEKAKQENAKAKEEKHPSE